MGRTGVGDGEAVAFIERLVTLPNLVLEGVFTHFPDADRGETALTEAQLARYHAVLHDLSLRKIDVPIRHAANSAGLLSVAASHLDMVRPGILAYGAYPTADVARAVKVEGILTFKSRIVQIREHAPGQNISYGCTYKTNRWTRVAVLPVGYGHGYPWALGNRGEVLIRGRRAPIVGRVTMDLTMVDVSGIPDARVEDEAVLWGEQRGARLGLIEVAERAQTIPYELLCGMGKRVVRLFLREGEPTKVVTLIGERRELEVAESGTGGAGDRRKRRRIEYKNVKRNP
jgi:alanine racemase